MIAIDNTLVSDDVITNKFVCDLNACKGACCVAGDSGAPLELEEIGILIDIYDKVKPFLPPSGAKTIEKIGVSVVDSDGENVTPLVDGNKHCAFTYFDENKTAKCGIEAAYYAGEITFKKPISCHLYPVRIKEHKTFTAVNFDEWSICKPACECGAKLNVPVYKFLKEPLTRKFGEDWYTKLTIAANEITTKKNK